MNYNFCDLFIEHVDIYLNNKFNEKLKRIPKLITPFNMVFDYGIFYDKIYFYLETKQGLFHINDIFIKEIQDKFYLDENQASFLIKEWFVKSKFNNNYLINNYLISTKHI